jgi:hypothetical protein
MGRDHTDTSVPTRANRRRFLAALGAVGVAGLAGCGGDGDDTTDSEGTTEPAETTDGMATTEPEETTTTGGGTPTPTATATGRPQTIPDPAPEVFSFEGGGSGSPGETITLSGTIQNQFLFPLASASVDLSGPDGWEFTATTDTSFEDIPTQGSEELTWELTAPDDADGEYTVSGTVSYTTTTDEAEYEITQSVIVFDPGEVPQEGLEAYFSFDSDTLVNQVTGTEAAVTGEPTTGADGVLGSAWEFTTSGDPTGSRNETTDAVVSGEGLPLNGEGATVGAWVNFTEHEAYGRFYQVGGSVSEPGAGSGGYEVIFHGNTDAPNDLLIADGDGRVPGLDGVFPGLSTGTWYFVVIVRDGTDYRLHVFDTEGELDASPATGTRDAAPPTTSSESLVMMSGDDSETAGRLDEVYGYSRAFSEEEVLQLYSGVGGSV